MRDYSWWKSDSANRKLSKAHRHDADHPAGGRRLADLLAGIEGTKRSHFGK
jgi:hypothetical protein